MQLLNKRASCTFTDASAASRSKASCATIVLDNIAVPSGTTLDLTDLTAGTSEEWSGPLFSVSGKNIAVSGASGHVLDGQGALWWDGEGSNGGKIKPKFFYVHSLTGTSTIKGLNFKNTPVQCFSVNGAECLTISDVTTDNSAGDITDGGYNTNAFDVGSSSDVTISESHSQEQPAPAATASPIGCVGGRDDNTVSDITISSSTITNSENGVRIKTVSGATGSVSRVTYKDITLSGITDYGIVIEQDYENGSPTGTTTTGVSITGLTVSGVTGTVESSATNICILCGSGSCSDWTWTGVDVTGGKTSTKCENVPSGASC